MWFYLALSSALISSVSNVLSKNLLRKHDQLIFVFLSFGLSLPFLGIVLFFMGGFPTVQPQFIYFVLISAILDFIAFLATAYAFKVSDLSLLLPIGSFIPVFTTLLAWLFLGESFTFIKFMGILTIVFGAYLLNIHTAKKGYFKPIKALFSDTGIKLVFLASLIWSITPLFQKKAIFATEPQSPIFTSFVGFCIVVVLYGIILAYKRAQVVPTFKKASVQFVLLGLLVALNQWAVFTAFALNNLGYITAIMKLSILFSMVLGAIFFKERNIKERLIGASIMLAGMFMLIF